MKKPTLLFIVVFAIWILILGCDRNRSTEQNQQTKNTEQLPNAFNQEMGEMNFQFNDAATGVAVVPLKIEIKSKNESDTSYIIPENHISQNGTASIKLPIGEYDLIVTAAGYLPMTISKELSNQGQDVNINLAALNPVKEISSEYIQSFHRNDAIIIVGFVTDDNTGQPIEELKVYSKDKVASTSTKTNGFFQLILPLAENQSMVEDRGTLFFEKENYVIEVRRNFDMWPKGDFIFKIKMKPGKGINSEDVIEGRPVSRVTLDNK